MKTKKITKKLTLNKLTVSSLNATEQQAVKGGYFYTRINGGTECYSWDPICPTQPLYKCALTV